MPTLASLCDRGRGLRREKTLQRVVNVPVAQLERNRDCSDRHAQRLGKTRCALGELRSSPSAPPARARTLSIPPCCLLVRR